MSAFIKSDLRKTGEYGDCFNQYLFDILSSLVDKSNEQVLSEIYSSVLDQMSSSLAHDIWAEGTTMFLDYVLSIK